MSGASRPRLNQALRQRLAVALGIQVEGWRYGGAVILVNHEITVDERIANLRQQAREIAGQDVDIEQLEIDERRGDDLHQLPGHLSLIALSHEAFEQLIEGALALIAPSPNFLVAKSCAVAAPAR